MGGTNVAFMQVQNETPLLGVFESDSGIHISPGIPFLVNGKLDNGDPIGVEVNPSVTSPANQLDIQLDLDAQQLSVNGNLQGQSGSFSMQLAIMATADSPFANLPPIANAGPDQTLQTSCLASVQLDPSHTSDPNSNLGFSYFRDGTLSLGDGSSPISLLPGQHVITLVATDSRGAQSTDDVVINVNDNGSVPTVAGDQPISIGTPPSVLADQVVLGASGTLTISDRVTVRAAAGGVTPAVVNVGQTSTEFGVDSVTAANVWSKAPVFQRERSQIQGSLNAVSILPPQNNTVVTGSTNTNPAFSPATSVGWNAVPNADTTTNVSLEPGQTASPQPGGYGQLTIKSNAQITLQSGSYSFSNVDIEPQASVVLQGSDPVVIYTSGSLIFRGTQTLGSGVPPLLVVDTGTSTATVEAPFTGTVIAPNASLSLASSGSTLHRGAFFAANINVGAGATIEFVPQSFDFVRQARSACAIAPVLSCVEPLVSGFRAHLTYTNQALYQSARVPVGLFNRFAPGPEDRGQPAMFLEGATLAKGAGPFTVDFTSPSITWTLGDHSVTASSSSPRCN